MRAKVLAVMMFAALMLGGQTARAQYVDQFAERYHMFLVMVLQINGQVTALGLNVFSAALKNADAEGSKRIAELFEREGNQVARVFNSQSLLLGYITGPYSKKPTMTKQDVKDEIIRALDMADMRLGLYELYIKTFRTVLERPIANEQTAIKEAADIKKQIQGLKEAAQKRL